MNWFFATMMVLAHFNPLLPKAGDYIAKSPAEIVKAYSMACLAQFNQPEFKNLDLPSLIQGIQISAAKSAPTSYAHTKIDPIQLLDLYKKICHDNPDLTALDPFSKDISSAAAIYRDLVAHLPHVGDLRHLKLSQAADMLSADGQVIGQMYRPQARRIWVNLNDLPPALPKAFVAVEDRRFYQHNGVDQIGIMRALFKGMVSSKRQEGASTITQQVARNLFLDDKVSMSRKLSEMLLAEKIEKQLTKNQILQLYLNLVYFGRNSWGVEEAARTYFGKSAKDLSPIEIAYLVGIVKGPNLYQYPDTKTENRVQFVLDRMYAEKLIPKPMKADLQNDLHSFQTDTDHAAYFRDYLTDSVSREELNQMLDSGKPIQTTLNDKLQTISEAALQKGLLSYEESAHRNSWRGPIANIATWIENEKQHFEKQKQLTDLEQQKSSQSLFGAAVAGAIPAAAPDGEPDHTDFWLRPLHEAIALHPQPLPNWIEAVVLDPQKGIVGLSDGSKITLSQKSLEWASPLQFGDIVYITISNNQDTATLVQPPNVNGAVIALDPSNGHILAMVGGFSYALSSWNRALSPRQPGSLVKPFTYMAALQAGYQPNFLLHDGPFIFPPSQKGGHEWEPHNYERNTIDPRPMRWALEQSRNVMTADLMSYLGMDPIRALMREFGVYADPSTNYPLILGAQETTLLALCRAYAAIDTGFLPSITVLESQPPNRKTITGVDNITLFQIRYLMQGVLARGTASPGLHDLAEFVAGKTGTTDDSRDNWFIGFTPHLVVGVYVGYDEPQSLGNGASGATVAVPIASEILRASFQSFRKPEAFAASTPGVTFLYTNRITGQVENQQPNSQQGNDIIDEAYRATHIVFH